MEPLHSYTECARAVDVLNQLLDKLQLEGLSEYEAVEFKELEKRVIFYRFTASKTVADSERKADLFDAGVVCDRCGGASFIAVMGNNEMQCVNCSQPLLVNKC